MLMRRMRWICMIVALVLLQGCNTKTIYLQEDEEVDISESVSDDTKTKENDNSNVWDEIDYDNLEKVSKKQIFDINEEVPASKHSVIIKDAQIRKNLGEYSNIKDNIMYDLYNLDKDKIPENGEMEGYYYIIIDYKVKCGDNSTEVCFDDVRSIIINDEKEIIPIPGEIVYVSKKQNDGKHILFYKMEANEEIDVVQIYLLDDFENYGFDNLKYPLYVDIVDIQKDYQKKDYYVKFNHED